MKQGFPTNQEYLIRSIKVDKLKAPGLNMTKALRTFEKTKKPNQEMLSITHLVNGEDFGGITNHALLDSIFAEFLEES